MVEEVKSPGSPGCSPFALVLALVLVLVLVLEIDPKPRTSTRELQ
jgi:hypothetical protein